MELHENLAALMKQKKMSLTKLAKESGVPKSTLQSWTKGQGTVNLDQLKKVADLMKVSVHQLAYGHPDPHTKLENEILTELFKGDLRVTVHKIEKGK